MTPNSLYISLNLPFVQYAYNAKRVLKKLYEKIGWLIQYQMTNLWHFYWLFVMSGNNMSKSIYMFLFRSKVKTIYISSIASDIVIFKNIQNTHTFHRRKILFTTFWSVQKVFKCLMLKFDSEIGRVLFYWNVQKIRSIFRGICNFIHWEF